MSDASGQHPNVFQPLGAQQLRLNLPLLRHVRIDVEDRGRVALRVLQEGSATLDDDVLAASGHLPQFPDPFALFQHRLPDFRSPGQIFPVKQLGGPRA